MSLKKMFPYALTALLTLSTACGGDDDDDDPTGPSGDQLSTTEFSSMLDAMAQVGLFAFSPGLLSGPPSTPGIAAQAQTVPLDETEPCPNGGTVRLAGNVTFSAPSQTSFSYNGNLTQTFNGCKAAGLDGTVFTFSGSPSFGLQMTLTQETYDITLHNGGNIGWALPSKSGSCSLNPNITATYNVSGTYAGSVSGSVCGQSISETF
jgi:hypothetical protein